MVFAGDEVRLAGQLDYPSAPRSSTRFPLLFILHHACGSTRDDYADYADIGLDSGYAVFRWDKRGTGRSGGGGRGSTTQDAVNAYEIALEQPHVDRKRAVILALGAGTGLLGSSFGLFARVEHPYAALLVANMLDEKEILALDTRLHVVSGQNDWNSPESYAEAAVAAHNRSYRYGAACYVAPNASRMLLTEDDTLHDGARKVMRTWLKSILQPSTSI
jgi:pimeloyl-ACP methyl ester carboxylesterase